METSILLSVMIFISSAVNSVHSETVTGTITVGKSPNAIAYDSSKGEIFVVNGGNNTVYRHI